jgi:putative transcriptional regulator
VAPEDTADPPAEVRLFAGSAGWDAAQLDSELAEQAWWVVDADADDAFTDDPVSLWCLVVGRQRGTIAWFAHFPHDLRAN